MAGLTPARVFSFYREQVPECTEHLIDHMQLERLDFLSVEIVTDIAR